MGRACLVALAGAAAAAALPGAAVAGVTCAYDGDAQRLEVRVRGESALAGDTSVGHVVRDGPLIRVIRQNEVNGARKRIECGGPVRFRSTGSVLVTMHRAALGLSLHRGRLPQTSVESRTLGNAVFVGATDQKDRISLWRSEQRVRADVNGVAGEISDLSLAVRGRPLFFLQANGLGGDDLIAAQGPPRSERAPHIGLIGTGGKGDDTLSAGRGASILAGGGGDDRLFGGAAGDALVGGGGKNRLIGRGGDDRIDTGDGRGVVTAGAGNDFIDAEEGFGPWGPDRIDCGSGRDGVDVDRGDRLRGCEVGVPR